MVFLSGHGERHINGAANFDWGDYGQYLTKKGIAVQLLDLSTSPGIPDNASVLVIASPQIELLPGEVTIIQEYIDGGGNLLITIDPYEYNGLDLLVEKLGIGFIDGVIHDPNIEILYKIQDPTYALVVKYPDHPITKKIEAITLFPKAMALEVISDDEYAIIPLLQTLPQSWSRPINSSLSRNGGKKGPLNIGYVLTREKPDEEEAQRIVIIGDGDFLSNQSIGNGSNIDLGTNIINWLSHDDKQIKIPVKFAQDRKLELSMWLAGLLEIGFKVVFPLGLILFGIVTWIIRKRK